MGMPTIPIRQNSCRLDRATLGAAKKDEHGPIRTSIQRQGAGPLAGTRERSAARELRRWVHGGGKVLPGLVTRREAEVEMLLSQESFGETG